MKRPKIELLSPDLDLSTPFIPGYDLVEQKNGTLMQEQILAIALTLWELTTATIHREISPWVQSQRNDCMETNNLR